VLPWREQYGQTKKAYKFLVVEAVTGHASMVELQHAEIS
jgi:hypothetical protein